MIEIKGANFGRKLQYFLVSNLCQNAQDTLPFYEFL